MRIEEEGEGQVAFHSSSEQEASRLVQVSARGG